MGSTGSEWNLSMVYKIRLKGVLSDEWADWFDGMAISYDAEGNTTLSGQVSDQSALHGLLDRVRDIGLPLLDIQQLEP